MIRCAMTVIFTVLCAVVDAWSAQVSEAPRLYFIDMGFSIAQPAVGRTQIYDNSVVIFSDARTDGYTANVIVDRAPVGADITRYVTAYKSDGAQRKATMIFEQNALPKQYEIIVEFMDSGKLVREYLLLFQGPHRLYRLTGTSLASNAAQEFTKLNNVYQSFAPLDNPSANPPPSK